MAEALLALGGNVGDVRATLDRAVAELCDGVAVRLLARSSDYRTPPWGVKDQPPFVTPKSPIAGLFETGASVSGGGFQPTLENGAKVARVILREMGV